MNADTIQGGRCVSEHHADCDAREIAALRRYVGYLKDSPLGNRCLDCGHVKHNELGYCQIGQCSCEYHNSIEGLGRLIERDLNSFLTSVTSPAETCGATTHILGAEYVCGQPSGHTTHKDADDRCWWSGDDRPGVPIPALDRLEGSASSKH